MIFLKSPKIYSLILPLIFDKHLILLLQQT